MTDVRVAALRGAIDQALAATLNAPAVRARFALVDPGFLEDLQAFVTAGGKRFRPLLLALAADTFGAGRPSPRAVMDAAVAMELFHAFLLIHDDVMDRAELRRGRPTLRARLAARWQGRPVDGLHLGDHMSIVLGDVCFALALELLNGLDAPPDRVRAVLAATLDYAVHTGMGQLLDVLHAVTPAGEVDVAEIERCYDLKTARYTIECPLRLGALLADAPDAVCEAIGRFARALGIAYQLSDDLIGVRPAEAPAEKSATSDFEEGRQTVLLAHTLARADAADAAWLRAGYGAGPLDAQGQARLLALYHSTGAVDDVTALIARLRQEATAEATTLLGSGPNPLLDLIAQLLTP